MDLEKPTSDETHQTREVNLGKTFDILQRLYTGTFLEMMTDLVSQIEENERQAFFHSIEKKTQADAIKALEEWARSRLVDDLKTLLGYFRPPIYASNEQALQSFEKELGEKNVWELFLKKQNLDRRYRMMLQAGAQITPDIDIPGVMKPDQSDVFRNIKLLDISELENLGALEDLNLEQYFEVVRILVRAKLRMLVIEKKLSWPGAESHVVIDETDMTIAALEDELKKPDTPEKKRYILRLKFLVLALLFTSILSGIPLGIVGEKNSLFDFLSEQSDVEPLNPNEISLINLLSQVNSINVIRPTKDGENHRYTNIGNNGSSWNEGQMDPSDEEFLSTLVGTDENTIFIVFFAEGNKYAVTVPQWLARKIEGAKNLAEARHHIEDAIFNGALDIPLFQE